jgi:dipeptidyl aminopeptidase/acylaminoacyl peptidase
VGSLRRTGLLTAAAAAPFALAYRFAVLYRLRAGYPLQLPPNHMPDELGLSFEPVAVPSDGLSLPGWFIPAGEGRAGPGVVLVHGWESARDRMLPTAAFLHAAGFHVLAFDVRGNGENRPEELPVTAGEYGADAAAAVRYLAGRADVTSVGIMGHSMGGVGALIAAARVPGVAAAVSAAAPADPFRLARLTFRLARLPLPDPVAIPLAWLTARVFLRPRGHALDEVSAARAAARYRGPLLLLHGELDAVVPLEHLRHLTAVARRARADAAGPSAAVRSVVVPAGDHSYLYELAAFRSLVASFLAESLGGPIEPAEAGRRASAVDARRLPEPELLTALDAGPVGLRALAAIVLPSRVIRHR